MTVMTKCKYIDDYIGLIRSGKIPTSKEIKQAMDLVEETLSDDDVFIDVEKTEKAAELISKYFDVRLFEWELFVLALVHCYYKSTNTVVFKEFIIVMGRGNGKNGFISGLSWYLTTHYHGINGYNVDIVANSEDQAMTSFNDILEVLEKRWDKMKKFFYKSKILIKNLRTNSYIKFNTSNAKTKDGKRSACLIFDEIHEYENFDMIKVLSSGFGKRKHSRIFYITTNGYTRGGVLDKQIEIAKDVLDGAIKGMRVLPLIYKVDSEDEIHNSDMWEKANPSLRHLPILKQEIEDNYKMINYRKDVELDFLTKRMNLPRNNMEMHVTEWENIIATKKEMPSLIGENAVVGIDYAMLNDWAAVNFHFKIGDERYDRNFVWVCGRSPNLKRIKAPWREWADDGLITIVDDVEISPELIADCIYEQGKTYNILKIAMDSYRHAALASALWQVGFDAKERKNITLVRPSDIAKVIPVVDSCFNRQLFNWGDNPVLRWATQNTKLVPANRKKGEDTGNFFYSKIEAELRKTDPFMALAHSMTIESELETKTTVFDDIAVILF